MLTNTNTTTTVTIAQADFITWLAANVSALPLGSAAIEPQTQNDGRVFSIVFPVDDVYLDTFLRGVILDLPAKGSYEVEVFVNNPAIVGRVSWQTDT